MIPRCYPTTYATANGTTKMVVNSLASTTGLTAWVDYIPTKKLTPAQKASAKAKAKAAGRPYPNLVDNAAAKKSKKK